MFFYKAYGLNIQSQFFIPELPQIQNQEEKSDVYIQKNTIQPPTLEFTSIKRQGIAAAFGGSSQEACLHWQGIATLLAKDGCNLIVEPGSHNIDPQLLNLYILSEALGLILYQKGFFLLHASAVKIGERVVIFAGSPGAGKSTTATAFAKYGYTVLADDMVAMKLDKTGQVMVYPGFPQIKIWPSTAKGLGYNLSALPTLFSGSRKRVIRQRENFPVEPFPLANIFLLEAGEKLNITPMEGTDAFFNLIRFFPLPSNILQGDTRKKHLQQCIQILKRVDIYKLENPKNFQTISKLIDWIKNKLDDVSTQNKICA